MQLTGKQRRHLRGLGHALQPVVHIGKEGVSEGVLQALDSALADHELIKVRLTSGSLLDRDEAAEEMARGTRSEVAQVLGNTVLLYRPDPEEPRIQLPAPGARDAG